MKYITSLLLFFALLSCNSQVPTQFTEAALNDTFEALDGSSKSLKSILESHKGKTIFIDIWASWCGDCIKGMPKVQKLKKGSKDVVFVFFSLDKNREAWKRGIKKYHVEGENYFMTSGSETPFGEFVDIDWIPRYMIVDEQGNIKLFKAVEANDKRIKEFLK